MRLDVRQAGDEDLPAVLGLYAQPAMDDGKVLGVDKARELLKQFTRYPSYRLFVACNGPEVVGTYALLIMHNLAHCGAPSAIVEDVVVAAHCQGLGIGSQMMAHAMEQAREAGCYKLALSSNCKRKTAHAFYESLGFVQHGVSFVIQP